MVPMTHLDDDSWIVLLNARQREYERLAACYAGAISRCGRLGAVIIERLAVCRAQQERLTAGSPSR